MNTAETALQRDELNMAVRAGTKVWLPLAAIYEEDEGLTSRATAFAVEHGMRPSLGGIGMQPGVWENSLATALPRARLIITNPADRPRFPIRTLSATGKLAITALRIHTALQILAHPEQDPVGIREQEMQYMVERVSEIGVPRFERAKFDSLRFWGTRLGRAITDLDVRLNRTMEESGVRKAVAGKGRLLCDEGLRLFMGTVATFQQPGEPMPLFPSPHTPIERATPWRNYAGQLLQTTY